MHARRAAVSGQPQVSAFMRLGRLLYCCSPWACCCWLASASAAQLGALFQALPPVQSRSDIARRLLMWANQHDESHSTPPPPGDSQPIRSAPSSSQVKLG
jgi:hypothetical protein